MTRSSRWRGPGWAVRCMRRCRRRATGRAIRINPARADPAVIAAWRQRMGTEAAKTIYKERAATSECVNAIARNRGLQQFLVRGLAKVKAVLLWFALAHNMMRAVALRRAAEAAG